MGASERIQGDVRGVRRRWHAGARQRRQRALQPFPAREPERRTGRSGGAGEPARPAGRSLPRRAAPLRGLCGERHGARGEHGGRPSGGRHRAGGIGERKDRPAGCAGLKRSLLMSHHEGRRGPAARSAFTLIELLVVVAVISILAAILLPVFARARDKARQAACASNMRQAGMGLAMYLQDYDDIYPEEHPYCPNPVVGTSTTHPPGDYDGSLESVDYGVPFDKILPYVGGPDDSKQGLYVCPSDNDPHGKSTLDANGDCKGSIPPAPPPGDLTSYLVNAYFLFGLSEAKVSQPANTIYIVERSDKFCDVHIHPWLGEIYDAPGSVGAVHGNTPYPACISSNPGLDHQFAVASARHSDGANYTFADGHVKWENYAQTIAPGPDQTCFGQ